MEVILINISQTKENCFKTLGPNSIILCELEVEELLIEHVNFVNLDLNSNVITVISEAIVSYLSLTV